MTNLCSNLYKLPNLSELYINWNGINNNGIKTLSDSFIHISKLTKLDLSCTDINSQTIEILTENFKYIPKLYKFNIGSIVILF